MKSLRTIVALFLLFACTALVHAQQPVFSQYYAAGLYLNPAQAGVQKDLIISSNYRTQWKSVDVPFKTFQVSCIYPVIRPGMRGKHLGGWGLSFLNDVAGPNKEFVTQSLHATGAYNFHLNKRGNNMIILAVQGGLVQNTINTGESRWSQQFIDGTTDVSENFAMRSYYPVVNVGMAWHYHRVSYTKKVFGTFHGFSVSNVNKPDESMFDASSAPVPMQVQVNGGFVFPINRNIDLCPTYLVRTQNDLLQTNTGAYLSYRLSPAHGRQAETRLIAGGWYRLKDSFILTTGLQTTHFACGFSYDRNVTSLNRYLGNAGAFEISAAYIVPKKNGARRVSTPLI
jgi:type IX secretion system PorP/SprF family membrane protein